MSASTSTRGGAFTNEELLAFVKAVEKRYETLFNTAKGPQYKKAIEEGWMEVGKECAELGFNRFKDKDLKQLRGDIWGKKKQQTLEKYDESQKTGSGATKFENWETIIIKLCKFTKQADGLEVSDSGQPPTEDQRRLLTGGEMEVEEVRGEEDELQIIAESTAKSPAPATTRTSPAPSSSIGAARSSIRHGTPYTVRTSSTIGVKRKKLEDDDDAELNLSDARTKLQIEVLKADLEMKKLMVYEKKTALGIPAVIECDGVVVANEPMRSRRLMQSTLYQLDAPEPILSQGDYLFGQKSQHQSSSTAAESDDYS